MFKTNWAAGLYLWQRPTFQWSEVLQSLSFLSVFPCFHPSSCISSWQDVSTSPSNSETFWRDAPSVSVHTSSTNTARTAKHTPAEHLTEDRRWRVCWSQVIERKMRLTGQWRGKPKEGNWVKRSGSYLTFIYLLVIICFIHTTENFGHTRSFFNYEKKSSYMTFPFSLPDFLLISSHLLWIAMCLMCLCSSLWWLLGHC